MSGLIALLDDVTALVKLTAASLDDIAAGAGRASVKAAGVVVDDAAVTPQYVHGLRPERELPIIRKIALGSLRNKLLFILPAALLLSQFLPWMLTPLLMLGGVYLSFEGAEKVLQMLQRKKAQTPAAAADMAQPNATEDNAADSAAGAAAEKALVRGAITTDFILSAEIMVIALNEVAEQQILARAIILVVVAIAITVLVYGVVGLIVKMDDAGLALARSSRSGMAAVGRALVAGMPKLLQLLSFIGTFAMLWVGGHILLVGSHDLGLAQPAGLVHHWVEDLHALGAWGSFAGWWVETLCSLVIGLLIGSLVVAVTHLLPRHRHNHGNAAHAAETPEEVVPAEQSGSAEETH